MNNFQLNQKSIKIKKRFIFLILAFFLLLNFATSGGHLYSIDDVQYYLHTENLALNQSIKFDPTSSSAQILIGEKYLQHIMGKNYEYLGLKSEWTEETPLAPHYDPASLLVSFIAVPIYYSAVALSYDPVHFVGFFTNSIALSLTSVMIFLTGHFLFNSKKISFVLALVFLVTTFVWSYNTGMMLRPFATLFAFSAFYFIISSSNSNLRIFAAGSCIGLALLASSPVLIVLPAFIGFGIFHFRKNKKQITMFLIGVIIFFLIQAAINEVRYDSITDFGFGRFQEGSIHSETIGLKSLLFSPGWGLFFLAPLTIFFPLSFYTVLKKNIPMGIFFISCFLIVYLFHGTMGDGPGPGSWGPRYLLTIMPIMIISLGFLIVKYNNSKLFKTSFIVLGTFGFLVSVVGKLVWYYYGLNYMWQVHKLHTFENGWYLMNYDFRYIPFVSHLNVLITDFGSRMNINNVNIQRGLAPCNYDLFIYCKFDDVAFIAILLALGFAGFLILRYLGSTENNYQTT